MSQLTMAPGNVTFMCVAVGLPRPNITWFFLLNEVPIELSPAFISTSNGVNDREVVSVFILENIQPVMAGRYTCNATNEVGTDATIANLTVHGE